MQPEKTPPDLQPETPIKVLSLIARLNVGGPAKLLGWSAAGLDPKRFEHTLAAGRVPPGEDDMGPWVESLGVSYTMVPHLGRSIDPLRDIPCLFQILGMLIRLKPQVLATHTAKAGFIGRAALLLYRPLARLMGWPRLRALHTFHGHVFHGYFSRAVTGLFLFLERFLARWATWKVLVISRQQFDEIHGHYRVGRREQVEIVPIGVDIEQFTDQEKGRQEFRRELGLHEDELLFGAVGRIAEVKNYSLVVRTAAKFKQTAPELYQRSRFVLIGDGKPEEVAALKQLAAELGVAERFQVLGYRQDPERFFPALDVLLLTSTNEGTPVSILEAGVCARPVLSTQVGGVIDLLGEVNQEDSRGFVIRQRGIGAPSEDADAMAHGLAHLARQPDLKASLGQALREYVYLEHSKESYVAHMARLFEQAAAKD